MLLSLATSAVNTRLSLIIRPRFIPDLATVRDGPANCKCLPPSLRFPYSQNETKASPTKLSERFFVLLVPALQTPVTL
jgi:hypothetical protein